MVATLTSLDPQKISGDWENRIDGDMFEGLVTEDPSDNPIPGQAASWTISADQKVYTFKLRDGIKWSDGTPVTASDFVFAFQRLMDPKTAAQYAYSAIYDPERAKRSTRAKSRISASSA